MVPLTSKHDGRHAPWLLEELLVAIQALTSQLIHCMQHVGRLNGRPSQPAALAGTTHHMCNDLPVTAVLAQAGGLRIDRRCRCVMPKHTPAPA